MNKQIARAEHLKQLNRVCDQFESLWLSGDSPALAQFLLEVDRSLRDDAFRDLFRIELECRHDRGHKPSLVEYVSLYPDHADALKEVFADFQTAFETSDGIHATLPSRDHKNRPASTDDANSFAEFNRLLEQKRRGELPPYGSQKALAQGGMGAVLIGHDRALQRQVAIKVMKPKIAESESHRARFLEEAQITGQLEHPNIVPIHDLGKDADGNLYFSMKLVKGKSLGQLLDDIKREESAGRTVTELLSIVLKISDALAFAHSKGVIHRDLKPDNIMIGDFGEVLVMDWGLAKLLSRNTQKIVSSRRANDDTDSETADDAPAQTIMSIRATDARSQTIDGTVQGTPAYMAPEQARGEVDRIDERSDVYSLGAILYEVLTLQRPIAGATPLDVVKNAAAGNVIPLEQCAPDRSIPPELSAVAMKAMRFAQEDRYQAVKEFKRDITLFLEGRAVSAKEDSLLESTVKMIRRNKAVSSATGVAAIIILVLGTFSLIQITAERDLAVANEQQATQARRKQWETSMTAAKQFALQAVELAHVNRLESAQRRANDAALVGPDGPWQFFASGAIAMAGQDYSGATKLFRTALSNPDGDQPEIRAALADALALEGNLQEAQTVLANFDKIDDWRVLLGAGRVLYAAHDWDACQRPLSRSIELMKLEKDRPIGSFVEATKLLDAAPVQKACKGFYAEIRDLPPEQLAKRVNGKLAEINGGRTGNFLSRDAADRWVFLPGGASDGVPLKHIYPIRGLPITRCKIDYATIWDLSPLQGSPLVSVELNACAVSDLAPLADSQTLERLTLKSAAVTDLSPLQNLQLKRVEIDYTTIIKDLAPLARMPLEVLKCGDHVTDFSPLRGMMLRELATGPHFSDLSVLKGMPLTRLDIRLAKVDSLEPLRGMQLDTLIAGYTWISDLSPLTGMPLKVLDVTHTQVADLDPVKTCPIEKLSIAACRVKDLSPITEMPLKDLDLSFTDIADLGKLRGTKIESLDLRDASVDDLSALADLPLKRLKFSRTSVGDLSPLRGLPLEQLVFDYTQATDLSPLREASLNDLYLFGCWIKDYSPLATMPRLDLKRFAWAEYLLNRITQRELYERHQIENSGLPADDVAKEVAIYVAMKEYAEHGPAGAIRWLEKYIEKWGTTTPTKYCKPDFIETQLKRLRDELASKAPGDT